MGAQTRAVLFDFGGTLFDYADLARGQLESVLALADRLGIEATPAELARAQRRATGAVFRDYLARPYYLHEDFFADSLRALGRELGVELSNEDVAFYFQVQHANRARDFRLREGVHETLAALRDAGLHLGIVSNIDEADLHHLIDLGELRPRFDSLLSSEAARSCKPDHGIFRIALDRAGCEPEEALFVGDTLAQDVLGANQIGMRSVLLWHRDDRPPPADGARPHHVIRRIPELLDLVRAA
ncbi:MAG TPA: HAD family hydrolase [Candidatus Binatia bacterium]|nr:HAD family hydrolase [Candidatus Binatia bacterium]